LPNGQGRVLFFGDVDSQAVANHFTFDSEVFVVLSVQFRRAACGICSSFWLGLLWVYIEVRCCHFLPWC